MFLHPSQRGFVDRRFNGPTRVSGSAGTGKTIVAIHRAVAALTAAQGHVLLTTFSDELAKSLRKKTQLLIPADRLTDRLPEFDSPSTLVVASLEGIATQLMTREAGQQRTVTDAELLEMIETIANEDKSVSLSSRFLLDEWNNVVDGWNLDDWAEYRDFRRLGRKTRLGESGRRQAWDVFERLRQQLSRRSERRLWRVRLRTIRIGVLRFPRANAKTAATPEDACLPLCPLLFLGS